MQKRDLAAIVEAGGLTVEGNETIAELGEALTHLVKARRH